MARRDGGLHPPPLVPRRRITSTQIPFEILSGHESSAAVCGRGTDRPTEMAERGARPPGDVEIAQIYRSIQQTVGAISFFPKSENRTIRILMLFP